MNNRETILWMLSLVAMAILAFRLGVHYGEISERQRAVDAGAAVRVGSQK